MAFSSVIPKSDMGQFFNKHQCPLPSKITPPEKWSPEDIVKELPDFIETLECVVESLKSKQEEE